MQSSRRTGVSLTFVTAIILTGCVSPVFTVNVPNGVLNVLADASQANFRIEFADGQATTWNTQSSETWATLDPPSGTGSTDLTVTIDRTAAELQQPGTYTATLTVSAGGATTTFEVMVTVQDDTDGEGSGEGSTEGATEGDGEGVTEGQGEDTSFLAAPAAEALGDFQSSDADQSGGLTIQEVRESNPEIEIENEDFAIVDSDDNGEWSEEEIRDFLQEDDEYLILLCDVWLDTGHIGDNVTTGAEGHGSFEVFLVGEFENDIDGDLRGFLYIEHNVESPTTLTLSTDIGTAEIEIGPAQSPIQVDLGLEDLRTLFGLDAAVEDQEGIGEGDTEVGEDGTVSTPGDEGPPHDFDIFAVIASDTYLDGEIGGFFDCFNDEPGTPFDLAEILLAEFVDFDTDQSGTLTYEEITALIPDLEDESFSALDLNNNGEITQEELFEILGGGGEIFVDRCEVELTTFSENPEIEGHGVIEVTLHETIEGGELHAYLFVEHGIEMPTGAFLSSPLGEIEIPNATSPIEIDLGPEDLALLLSPPHDTEPEGGGEGDAEGGDEEVVKQEDDPTAEPPHHDPFDINLDLTLVIATDAFPQGEIGGDFVCFDNEPDSLRLLAETLLSRFLDFDTDQNGTISLEEASQEFSELTDEEFAQLDHDGDGQLSEADLQLFLFGTLGEEFPIAHCEVWLSGDQVDPNVDTQALGHGELEVFVETRTGDVHGFFHLEHDIEAVTGAAIAIGEDLIIDLGDGLSPIEHELSLDELAAISDGLLNDAGVYVTVFSQAHPDLGEIRGHLDCFGQEHIEILDCAVFLDGGHVDPPVETTAQGEGNVHISANALVGELHLSAVIDHTVEAPVGASLVLHGQPIFELGDGTSPIESEQILTFPEIFELFSGDLFFPIAYPVHRDDPTSPERPDDTIDPAGDQFGFDLQVIIGSETHPEGEIAGPLDCFVDGDRLFENVIEMYANFDRFDEDGSGGLSLEEIQIHLPDFSADDFNLLNLQEDTVITQDELHDFLGFMDPATINSTGLGTSLSPVSIPGPTPAVSATRSTHPQSP